MNIGERLRIARKRTGLSAKILSERSGVPEKTIYRIETGEVTDPKISSVRPLISSLNCTADEILFDPSELTGFINLKRALIRTTKLNNKDIKLITGVINKLCLASEILNQVSEHAEIKNSEVEDEYFDGMVEDYLKDQEEKEMLDQLLVDEHIEKIESSKLKQ